MTPTTVCLSPVPKKLCRFQQDRAKQDLKVNLRGLYRRKALGVASAAVSIARPLHYCPSLSCFGNKAASLPHDSEKCWSGTFHTPPFTALELNHKKKQLQIFISKTTRTSGGLGAKRVIGTDSVGYSDLSSEVAGSRFIDLPAGLYLCLLDFPLDINNTGGAARQQKGWRPPGYQNTVISLVF